jgi:hypothetical protein
MSRIQEGSSPKQGQYRDTGTLEEEPGRGSGLGYR